MSWSTTETHMNVWPAVREALEHRYEIIDWIDLLANDTDIQPQRLYNILKPFSDRHFEPNQRVIILHRDNDYYCNEFGFIPWNLYKIISRLNIPSEYFVMITAYKRMDQESKKLAQHFNVPAMTVVYCPYQYCPVPENVFAIQPNKHLISHPYVCLNGVPRNHRMYVLCQLQQNKLLDSGMVTLWPDRVVDALTDHTQVVADDPVPAGLHLRTTHPPTRVNDDLILSPEQASVFHGLHHDIYRTRTHPLITKGPNDASTRYQPEFLQHALWNLVTESIGEYPHSYHSEKTWKAVLTKRPFILLGGTNSLKDFKDLGFETFDRWINEDYDQQTTFADRADRAIKALAPFCAMDSAQLQDFYEQIMPVVEYNFEHYCRNFGGTRFENFVQGLL